MSHQRPNPIYESGQWRLDPGRHELLACGVPVPIGARALEAMAVLVRSANELVIKDALMARIWPGAMVGVNTLQVHISAIRKALGPDRAMLKPVSGRGYRLQGAWTLCPENGAEPLVGPGGIGKTTLAPHDSRRICGTFDGDVWLIELAPLSDPGLVPPAVARVLGLNLAAMK
jgi:DNA-binding winged helix-turn-helix (wHTH) protein